MDQQSLHRRAIVIVLASLVIGAPDAIAAGMAGLDEGHADQVVRELGGIREELRALARLLEGLRSGQHVATLLTRIQLKQQQLSPIEGLLRSARREQEAVEQELERVSGLERALLDRVATERGDKALNDDARQELEVMRQQKTILSTRVETLRMRVVEHENELARALKDIKALEEAVDEQLGLR